MKLLSIVVPSYNAEKYLDKCLSSLVVGGDKVEVIVVNDGSKDKTLEIAQDFARRYPDIISVIDKENGGHGSGVNVGIEKATGIYFKVVDADDWLCGDSLKELLNNIEKQMALNSLPDLFFTDFVYEDLNNNRQILSDFGHFGFPKNKIFTFEETKKIRLKNYFMMHSLIFKTSILKESKLHLLEHTYYVDNLYCFKPLYYVKTLYYLPIPLYRYYVGRANQSVCEKNLTKNYEQQLRVMEEMSKYFSLEDLKKLNKKQYKFMISELIRKESLSLIFIYLEETREKDQAYKRYWKNFRKYNPSLYRKIRFYPLIFFLMCLPKKVRAKIVIKYYRKECRKRHWN